jgi:hypothetical protein
MVAMVPPVAMPVFEDYDSLESGDCREFISEDLLTPTSRGFNAKRDATHHWVLCKLTRPHKSEFQLCSEGGDFLLCAKLVDDCYYVSTYEDFPASVDERGLRGRAPAAMRHVVAVLAHRKTPRGPCFELRLVSAASAIAPEKPLAEVRPSSIWCAEQGAELRRLDVALPAAVESPGAHYKHDWRRPPPPPRESRVRLRNKLPTWNKQLGCLSLHFGRKRVRTSSSKNFLIYTEDVLNDGAAREDADNAAFQLGKLAAKTFALDFRYPINPLQAFAVALTAFQIKHCKVPRATRSGSG